MFEDLRAKVHAMIADAYAAKVRQVNADIVWHRHQASILATRALAIRAHRRRDAERGIEPPPET